MGTKKDIADRYDSSAEVYDIRYDQIQQQKYAEILSRVKLSLEHHIIDIGCGTGNLLAILYKLLSENFTPSLLGVDLSFEMIKIAHQKYPEIDFIVADSDNLPIKENAFDHIFSVTHLQNLPNPLHTLQEINRIAKRNANIAISILRKSWTIEKLIAIIQQISFDITSEWSATVEDIGVLCSKP